MLAGKEEQVCLDARRHGIVLVRPFVWAIVLALAGGFLLTRGWPYLLGGAALLVLGAATALRAVWRWERTHVVVTTEKLVVAHGTLRRRAASVRLAGVDALELEQSLLGRLLGYGTLVAGPLEVSCVPDPRGLYRLVDQLSE
jgi:uncharacterized membrane protein YdbT with pleckstrin-like domain